MAYLVLISFIVLFAYLGITFVKYGIPNYISEGFYANKCKWAFSVTMVLVSGLLLPAMLESGNEDFNFLAFLSVACIFFLAAEPHFKSSWEGKIHNTSAIIAGVCSQLWCFLHCWQSSLIIWLFLTLVFAFGYKYVKQKEKPLKTLKMGYWIEVAAFFNVYLAFLVAL